VPDAEYTPHENTFLHLRKQNHKWVKLKSYKAGNEAGRWGARWHTSLSLWTFWNFLALKGL